jgi:hypothetical protein
VKKVQATSPAQEICAAIAATISEGVRAGAVRLEVNTREVNKKLEAVRAFEKKSRASRLTVKY